MSPTCPGIVAIVGLGTVTKVLFCPQSPTGQLQELVLLAVQQLVALEPPNLDSQEQEEVEDFLLLALQLQLLVGGLQQLQVVQHLVEEDFLELLHFVGSVDLSEASSADLELLPVNSRCLTLEVWVAYY